MLGVLMKWQMSSAIFIVLALLDVCGSFWVDKLGKNYGPSEQQLVDVVTWLNYLLPLIGFFWLKWVLSDKNKQLLNQSKIILWIADQGVDRGSRGQSC